MFIRNEVVPFVEDIKKNVIGWDNLWDDLVHREFPYTVETSFPKDNIIKRENEVVIELALAGYGRENISIERNGNRLTVSARKDEKEQEENVNYIRRHIATRAFTKHYTVATEYKDIDATFENGILSIRLEREPKQEEAKRLIEIK
jgi:HSP20 family molecular chaperone IbpA